MKLPLHERFHTWQGEGMHMGKPASFIRLFGCPVHCPWCDSAGTWHPEFVPKNIERVEVSELADWASAQGAPIVVITGGEPAIHDLGPLTDELGKRKLARHLETSGAFEIRGDFNWITLSPKKWKWPLEDSIARAHEFKIIVEEPADIELYWERLRPHARDGAPVWLHPEWSQRENAAVLNAISEAVKAARGTFRAGWQLHKLYRVDALDPRAAPPAPLGGNPQKGF